MPSSRRSDSHPRRDAINEGIAERAFELFLERGGQHGHDLDDWLQAEREVANAVTAAKPRSESSSGALVGHEPASAPIPFTAVGRHMALHTWRRHHGSEIVAQVAPVAGFSAWHAFAWRINNPARIVRRPGQFDLLMSAQAAADHLARREFDHTCDLDTCGDWMVWSRG